MQNRTKLLKKKKKKNQALIKVSKRSVSDLE
jgi:hypothetical protein